MYLKAFFLFFLSFICNSQINNLRVTYKITMSNDENLLEIKEIKDLYEKAINESKNSIFKLLVSKEESFFEIEKGISNGIQNAFISYNGSVYKKLNETYLYKNVSSTTLGNYLLKVKQKKHDWIFHQETKEISGILCYKATCLETIINPKGTFYRPILVWYAPQIPYSSGPLDYFGVPGLILELNLKNIVYGAVKIENNIEDFVIPKLDLSKVITENELNKMKEDFLNSKD